jgi:hypothetical protein
VIGGRDILNGVENRRVFLRALEEACGKSGWQVHAYALMGSHYHLLPGGGLKASKKSEAILAHLVRRGTTMSLD